LASLREKLEASLATITENENQYIANIFARKNRIQDVITLLVNVQG
jgi:hypothetical protein